MIPTLHNNIQWKSAIIEANQSIDPLTEPKPLPIGPHSNHGNCRNLVGIGIHNFHIILTEQASLLEGEQTELALPRNEEYITDVSELGGFGLADQVRAVVDVCDLLGLRKGAEQG